MQFIEDESRHWEVTRDSSLVGPVAVLELDLRIGAPGVAGFVAAGAVAEAWAAAGGWLESAPGMPPAGASVAWLVTAPSSVRRVLESFG